MDRLIYCALFLVVVAALMRIVAQEVTVTEKIAYTEDEQACAQYVDQGLGRPRELPSIAALELCRQHIEENPFEAPWK